MKNRNAISEIIVIIVIVKKRLNILHNVLRSMALQVIVLQA